MFSRKGGSWSPGLAGFRPCPLPSGGGGGSRFRCWSPARTLQGAFGGPHTLARPALATLDQYLHRPPARGGGAGPSPVYGAVSSGGRQPGVGLILGGVLTQYLSWRYNPGMSTWSSPGVRHRSGRGWPGIPRADRPATRPAGLDWAGTGAGLGRAVPDRVRFLPGPETRRLGGPPLTVHLPGRRPAAAGRVRGRREAAVRRIRLLPLAGDPRPDPGGRAPMPWLGPEPGIGALRCLLCS